MNQSSFSFIKGFFVSALFFGGVALVGAAWVDPTGPPPSGDVPAPINSGASGQYKDGGLILGNTMLGTQTALKIPYARLKIGDTNDATQALDVIGAVKASKVCISGLGSGTSCSPAGSTWSNAGWGTLLELNGGAIKFGNGAITRWGLGQSGASDFYLFTTTPDDSPSATVANKLIIGGNGSVTIPATAGNGGPNGNQAPNITSPRFCIGTSCITDWSQAGGGSGSVDWASITNKPAGFADNVDNTAVGTPEMYIQTGNFTSLDGGDVYCPAGYVRTGCSSNRSASSNVPQATPIPGEGCRFAYGSGASGGWNGYAYCLRIQ